MEYTYNGREISDYSREKLKDRVLAMLADDPELNFDNLLVKQPVMKKTWVSDEAYKKIIDTVFSQDITPESVLLKILEDDVAAGRSHIDLQEAREEHAVDFFNHLLADIWIEIKTVSDDEFFGDVSNFI